MTHLHLPDGVLPLWLWASGLALTALLIAISARVASGPDFRRRLPLLSMMSAFMVMSLSIPLIPGLYHLQLAALTGIVLGAAPSIIAVFIVNLLLALAGHGGVTVVGLNSIILGSEALAARGVFRLLKRVIPVGAAGGAAAFLAMLVGAGVMLAVIAPVAPHAGPMHFEEVTGDHEHEAQHPLYADAPYQQLSLRRLAFLVVVLGSVGWVLEATLTGLAVRFAARVKPDLVGLR